MARRSKTSERNRLLSGLCKVGPNKPIAYLPIYCLMEIAQVAPEEIAAAAVERGLVAVLLGPEECCIKSGALYIYDRAALSPILCAEAATLRAEGVPYDPDGFVRHIAAIWLEPTSPAMSAIRTAFADKS